MPRSETLLSRKLKKDKINKFENRADERGEKTNKSPKETFAQARSASTCASGKRRKERAPRKSGDSPTPGPGADVTHSVGWGASEVGTQSPRK